MLLTFEFIGGLVFGLEHMTGDEDDEFNWMIGLHLGIIRILFLSLRFEEE